MERKTISSWYVIPKKLEERESTSKQYKHFQLQKKLSKTDGSENIFMYILLYKIILNCLCETNIEKFLEKISLKHFKGMPKSYIK